VFPGVIDLKLVLPKEKRIILEKKESLGSVLWHPHSRRSRSGKIIIGGSCGFIAGFKP
jgi:hypothetical protein